MERTYKRINEYVRPIVRRHFSNIMGIRCCNKAIENKLYKVRYVILNWKFSVFNVHIESH